MKLFHYFFIKMPISSEMKRPNTLLKKKRFLFNFATSFKILRKIDFSKF